MDVSRFEWLEERDVWTTGAERTALVWQENCVTVAIAGPGTYYELSLNPANLTVDRGWSAECCLPWEGLARLADGPLPPEAGQVWRIGLARTQMIDHRAHRYPAVAYRQPLRSVRTSPPPVRPKAVGRKPHLPGSERPFDPRQCHPDLPTEGRRLPRPSQRPPLQPTAPHTLGAAGLVLRLVQRH